MKYGRSLVDLATELERQLATKQDMIVPTPLMHHVTSESGTSVLNIETHDGVRTFRTTENCRRQLADRLKIPFAYFERMRTDQPALLDRNIDTWLHAQPEQRMVRTLDGNARAFLSDRYRRLDNYDLLAHVYPMLRELPGARVESCEVTDSRMYLKVVTSRVQFELAPGDVVHAGVVISNSETGQGSLSVSPLVFRLLCRNGLIAADQAMRKTHIGRMTETSSDEVTFFKEDTLAADDAAFFRMATKSFCRQRNLTASFMALLGAGFPGIGGHVVLSLRDGKTGRNVFADRGDANGLSASAKSFLAGIIEVVPEVDKPSPP